jgi:hypothetical protein
VYLRAASTNGSLRASIDTANQAGQAYNNAQFANSPRLF